MEWKGLAARFRSISQHSLRADRRLERKESELPRAFAWASRRGSWPVEANALGKRGGWSGRAWQRVSAACSTFVAR